MLRKRRLGCALAGTALLASFIGPVGPASAAPPGGLSSTPTSGSVKPAGPAGPTGHSVTLLTGDRVTFVGTKVSVTPGPGRQGVSFLASTTGDHLSVVPSDAAPLVRAGKLDPRLFDVTALAGFGYDDRRDDLPLIVTTNPTARGTARSTVTTPGVTVTRDLPAVNGLAVRAGKTRISALWDRLTAARAGGPTARALSGGVATVWLDGLRTPTLDVSVPQIGAPDAWRAGFDGAGTTVAVLDTGIDASHPDLAGQVARASNFTEGEEDSKDRVGHGTHVASTIAGTGKASNGKYTGVAPKAKLLDGKVCVDAGCAESWILAGMQWAAEQGADVVNMSLGGGDTPSVDPLEKAVDTLTAQHGTLFVIAAGNSGEDSTISSPASADAALAVGAVDKSEALADFSSRGPRVDGGLKPDITGPGVDIVAANSADGYLGEAGQPYTTLSGTSMATPHVAGAAAILAQRHPNATPAELKALLMASAKPNPELGAFAQGAGRVDVAKAVGQTLRTEPPSLSFGRQFWPHADDSVLTRTVTYRNTGAEPVTLSLALKVTGPDGKAAPQRMFSLSATSVTVPAGGQAGVTVSADTRTGGPDGYYTGALTATGGGVSTTTPFAVDQEVESYDVTLRHKDRDGADPSAYFSTLYRVDEPKFVDVMGDGGTVTARVPKGTYALVGVIYTGELPQDEDDPYPDLTMLVQPKVSVTKDLDLSMDARRAKPLSVRVPRSDAKQITGLVSTDVYGEDFGFGNIILGDDFSGITTAQLGPNRAYPWLRTDISAAFGKADAEGMFTNSPYVYHTAWRLDGKVPTGFNRRVTADQLATVRATTARQGSRKAYKSALSSFGEDGWSFGVGLAITLPNQRTEYLNTDGGVRWESMLEEVDVTTEYEDLVSMVQGPVTRYRGGKRYTERWNGAVFGPSVGKPNNPQQFVSRAGDTLIIAPSLYGDADDRSGYSVQESARLAVYRNGNRIFEQADVYGEVAVPAAAGRYRVELEATRGAPAELSTKVSTAWTFRSKHVAGEDPVPLPISVVRFQPPVDLDNAAPAGRTVTVPVTVRTQPNSAATRCEKLTVWTSFDDGRTWQRARVTGSGGSWKIKVTHPAGAGFVSLRASAKDTAGNTVEQTILRAYRIAG